MLWTDKVSFLVLVFVLGAQVILRSFWFDHFFTSDSEARRKTFDRILKFMMRGSVLAIAGIIGYTSYLQYKVWAESPFFGKYLLPPYQSGFYFIGYVGALFWAQWIFALAAAIFIPLLAYYLNRRAGERFFEPEELPLFALGIFLTGYPGFLVYLVVLMVTGVLLSLYYVIRGLGRAPLYYLWLPAALFAMIMKIWVISPAMLAQFNF